MEKATGCRKFTATAGREKESGEKAGRQGEEE